MVGVSITKERKIGDLRQANIYLVVEFVIDTHQLKMIDKEIMGESGLYFFEIIRPPPGYFCGGTTVVLESHGGGN
jgi:hypothetical protein